MGKKQFVCGLAMLVLLSASGCSSSSGKTGTDAVPSTTASCYYADAMQCYEYFTAAAAQSYQSSCTESSGTWSATSGCKKEGKVKGCQATLSGVKTYTFWTYDAAAGPAAIEAFCKAGASQAGASAAQMTVVTP